MKKQLDTSVMENELRSGSAFFRAVPQRRKQSEQVEVSPPATKLKNSDPDAAPLLGSPLGNLPAIKPSRKRANLAPVMPLEAAHAQQPPTPPPSEDSARQMAGEKSTPEEMLQQTTVRPNVPTNERIRIRHTFDIFKDQLLSLRKIATRREEIFGRRVLLGELVQEALDLLITKEWNKV